MDKIERFECQNDLYADEFVSAATHIHLTGEIIHGFKYPQALTSARKISYEEECEAVIKNPILAVGMALLARLERWHWDYLVNENTTHLLLQHAIEVDVYEDAKFWMQSDIAAIDKANELGIEIMPEYSISDLRYKIHCAIQEALNGK